MRFAQIIQVLTDGSVEFVIVDDIAGVLHGSRRAELVIAVCYLRTAGNMGRLLRALAGFNPFHRGTSSFVWDENALRNPKELKIQTDLGAIDLLAEVAGVGGWEQVVAQSIEIDAFERRVRILDLPALIRAKRAAGRPKDLAVIPELEALLEALED